MIKVHKETDRPTKTWEKLRAKQKQFDVEPLPLDTPIDPSKLRYVRWHFKPLLFSFLLKYFYQSRFVCLSDTHARTDRMSHDVPPGDVLLHAGDFTNVGKVKDVLHFKRFLGEVHPPNMVWLIQDYRYIFDRFIFAPKKSDNCWKSRPVV